MIRIIRNIYIIIRILRRKGEKEIRNIYIIIRILRRKRNKKIKIIPYYVISN